MNKYFGFVYIWHDTKNSKFLIGSHHGKIEDSYTTSTGGKYVRNIFISRPETMKRRILEYCYKDDYRETQKLEQKWLNLRPNIASNPNYYNKKQYATGGIDKIVYRHKPNRWILGHRERQKKLAEEGKHNFNSDNTKVWAKKRVENGTHHFLKSEFNKKAFIIYLNGEFLGEFDSKASAVKVGLKAGIIDILRKNGKYTVQRGSYKKNATNKLFMFKKNDILEYKEVVYGNKNRP